MNARLSGTAYRMSFTMGGLFLNEAVAAAMAHERLGDWTQAQEEIKSRGPLGFRKTSSIHRAAGELGRGPAQRHSDEVMPLTSYRYT